MLVGHESGRMSIAKFVVDTGEASLVVVPSDYDVDFATWKDDRILFGGDAGGNESEALRSIRMDGTDWTDLSESYDSLRALEGPVIAHIQSMLRHDEDWILISGYGARRQSDGSVTASGTYGLYRMNVKSGKRLLVEPIEKDTTGLFVDGSSGVCYGRTLSDGDDEILELRSLGERSFREVRRFALGETGWSLQGLTPDGRHCLAVVQSEGKMDRGALVEIELSTGKISVVAYVPSEGEISRIRKGKNGKLWGVETNYERPEFIWFDPQIAKIHASLQATFPDQVVEITDSSMANDRFLVCVYSDRNPGEYFIYDNKEVRLIPLGKRLNEIDPELMPHREPITYTARDGLKIHGYLTRPLDADGPTPLIIMPHGGPFGIRDDWSFDADAAFLASRGYTVLQPNYRGSGGYGLSFQIAGQREWGGKMQDDLTDGVQWAIEEGYTTSDQVAIMGASYGGYATLAGLVYTPDLYRCGVNYVGVSNLQYLVNSTRVQSHGRIVWGETWIGEDDDFIDARSPVNFVEAIKVPSFHAYGVNDPRVDIQHWRVLERELKRYDKDYEAIVDEESGHGFQDEAARIKLFTAIEKFLAKNLPVSR